MYMYVCLEHPTIEHKVISGLLALIERDRTGESVNRVLVKSLLRMFSALRLYATSFQPVFLAATRAFYTAESTRHIASYTPVEYIHYIQHRLQQEDDRAVAVLDESSRAPLTLIMQQQLIASHSQS